MNYYKMFIVWLASIVNASNHTKFVSLCNQKFGTEHTLINSHPNEYSKELEYYLFWVKLGKCFGSCNTLNELSNRVCVSNKTVSNIHVFNKITGKKWIKNFNKRYKQIWWKKKCTLDQW